MSHEAATSLLNTVQEVLKLRVTMFGLRHFLYADSMFALAHILKKMGGQEEASLKLMNDAIRILEEAGK